MSTPTEAEQQAKLDAANARRDAGGRPATAPALPDAGDVTEPDGTTPETPGPDPVVAQARTPIPPQNPFDAAVGAALQKTPTPATRDGVDPMDAAVGAVVEDQQRQDAQIKSLTAWRATHQSTPPEKQMQVLQYSAASGLDPSVVENSLEDVKKQVDLKQLGARLQASPALAKFMADASKAPLVKDDVANLSGLEWALGKKWEYAPLVIAGAMFPPLQALAAKKLVDNPGAIVKTFGDALEDQKYIFLANQAATGVKLSPEDQQYIQDHEAQGERDYGADNFTTKQLLNTVKMVPYLAGDIAAGAVGAAATGIGSAGAAAETGPGAAVAGTAGATAGATAGTFAWNFYQNFGPQYRALKRMKDENGDPLLTDAQAREYAGAASTIGAGAMAALGVGILGKLPGVDKLFGKVGLDSMSKALAQKTVARSLALAPLKLGLNVAAGGTMMAIQAGANVGAEELAKHMNGQDADAGRITSAMGETFLRGSADMFLLAAIGSGREILHDYGQVARNAEDLRAFQAEAAAAENSKLLERSPEHFEEMHRLAQGENSQRRYIPVQVWDKYWEGQGLKGGDVAARVFGDDGKAYSEAATAGTDLAIPAEKFLSAFAKTEHVRGLSDEIRFTADGVSKREAREKMAALAEKAKQEDEAAKVAGVQDGADKVRDDVYQKAVAAKVPKKEAEANSWVWGAVMRRLGEAKGLSAWEAYNQHIDLRILRGEGETPPDTSFNFGGDPESGINNPESISQAQAAIARKAPKNREAGQAFIEYVQGKRAQRPTIEPALEKELADLGVVDPKYGYQFDESGRDRSQGTKTAQGVGARVGPKYRDANAEALRKMHFDALDFKAGLKQQAIPVDEGGAFKLNAGDRGFVTFEPSNGGSKPRRFDIHLLENADPSTFAHESAHVFAEVLGDVATAPNADEALKADYATALKWMGYDTHEQRIDQASERRAISKIDPEERTKEQDARLKELTGKEEKFTHAWEQYLREGKAPTLELAGVFARFRRWLTSIYRGVQAIGRNFQEQFGQPLNLSPEMRGVFDRLLTSEDEVRRAKEANEAAQIFAPALEHMTPEERAQYEKLGNETSAAAEDEVRRRIVEADHAENAEWFKQERAKVQAQVEAELDDNQAYRALKALQSPDPVLGDIRLDRTALVKKYGADYVRELPPGIFGEKGEGQGADEMAAVLGFDDGRKMLDALKNTQPRDQVVADETQRRLEETYGPSLLNSPDALAEMAQDAIETPAATRRAMLELNALRRALKAGAKDAVNPEKAAREKLEENVAQEKAQEEKAKTKAQAEADQEAQRQQKLREELLNGWNLKDAREMAEGLVRQRTVGELTHGADTVSDAGLAAGIRQRRVALAGEYQRAERQAAKRALEAASKGDFLNAIAQKERQLLNQELYRAARDLGDELSRGHDKLMDATTDNWRRKLGKASPTYTAANDAVLQAIGLQERDPSAPPLNIEGFVATATSNAQDVAFDQDAIRELLQAPKQWKDLSPDEALNIVDAVKNIKHLANALDEVLDQQKREGRDAWFNEVKETAGQRVPEPLPPRSKALTTKLQEGRQIAQSIGRGLITPESLVTMLDNHQENGPMRRVVLDGEAKCRSNKLALMREFARPIVDAFNALPKERQKKMMEQFDVSKELPLPEDLSKKLGEGPVTRADLLVYALNMGNSSNKQRFLDGYGWSESQVMGVLNKYLDKADWDFVQKTWDTLESMYPLVAAHHERLTGLKPPKIKATPVQTPFGTYAGGYFPAREESRAKTTPNYQVPELAAQIFGETYQRPSVAKGHTKARVERADYYVNTDWSVVPSHIAQVVHDLAYREYVQQTAQLLFDQRFTDISGSYLGPERAKEFIPWLQAIANQQADSAAAGNGAANRALSYVRGYAARTALSGNLPSLAFHILDPWLGAAGKVTTLRDTAAAFGKGFSPMWFSMRKFALENSPELQARSDTVTSELTRQLAEIGKQQRGLAQRAAETLAVFHHKMDSFVTTQTWTAKYAEIMRDSLNDGMKDEEAHARAVREADHAVLKVYPSGEIAQQARYLRQKNMLGVSLMFGGFANKMYNLGWVQAGDRASQAWRATDAGFTDKVGAVAAFAGTMLAMGVAGSVGKVFGGKGKEGDEDWAQWAERSLLAEPFSTVPLLDKVADQAAGYLVTGKLHEVDIRNAPLAEFVAGMTKRVYKAASQSSNLTDEQRLERYLETLSGVVFRGAGATQLQRTGGYAAQLADGEAQPRGPFDVASGLIYGNRPNQPANPLSVAQDLISGR